MLVAEDEVELVTRQGGVSTALKQDVCHSLALCQPTANVWEPNPTAYHMEMRY